MLALAPQEDLEMRLHVKCSGPTKKFGKGVFAVTNQRMLYDSYDDGLCFSHPIDKIDNIKRVGNHEFCLRWYENNSPYFFQGQDREALRLEAYRPEPVRQVDRDACKLRPSRV